MTESDGCDGFSDDPPTDRPADVTEPTLVGLYPRRRPQPPLPEHPYPLLLPVAHPELLAGRDRELREILARLDSTVAVTGLYAPSGTGKSSFLQAGLTSELQRRDRPTAFERYPGEPGLASRLLHDVAVGDPEDFDLEDDDADAFGTKVVALHRLSGACPVFVIDQLEDVLRSERRRERVLLGALIASSTRRVVGLDGPACRWVLAYREEFQGDVFLWLGDLFQDARAVGTALDERWPRDFSHADRFQTFPLSPLGTPAPGTEDVAAAASAIFSAAIEKPLLHVSERRFAAGCAARLADAFGRARARREDAPLAPELQVVLAYLWNRSGLPLIEVPDDPESLIETALEDHLRRALETAFPATDRQAQILRTRAVLVLRELADDAGRRGEGLPVESAARAIGEEGNRLLEHLTTASTRIVVRDRHAEEPVYVLAHDRLARVVVRLVDEGIYAGLGIDRSLLELRRLVAVQSELFKSEGSAAMLTRRQFARIEKHADALLWDDAQRSWWTACGERRRRGRFRRLLRGSAACVLLFFLSWNIVRWTERRERVADLWNRVDGTAPEKVFAAANALIRDEGLTQEVGEALRRRADLAEIFEHGLDGADPEETPAAVLRLAQAALPRIVESHRDVRLIAVLVWALDFAPGRDPRLNEQAREMRDRILTPLREIRPPPPAPAPEDPDWIRIPRGRFRMGANPEESGRRDERPRREANVSSFRLLRHETTNAEFRRLFTDHPGKDDFPAANVNWYEALVYAAWLGGRLPTEAEWEYAARAGCAFAYCNRRGEEAMLEDVAWTRPDFAGAAQPVMQLEPNAWGLYDMLGNILEWTADWYAVYPASAEIDPWGPPDGRQRTARGGSFWYAYDGIRFADRGLSAPDAKLPAIGFRVLLPEPQSSSDDS